MDILESLKPNKRLFVFDLVKAAGVDVSDWEATASSPNRIKNNGKYCYNWSFVEPGNCIVLCLWHDQLEEKEGQIYHEFNIEDWLAHFEANPKKHLRLSRARAFKDAIKYAYERQLPLRVIVVAGNKSDISDADAPSSAVARRLLDPEPWHIESLDVETTQCRIIRDNDADENNLYADQFSLKDDISEPPERRNTSGSAFKRSAAVRNSALNRARGRCEFCDEYGFKMRDGRHYLETHHVIPLSDGGLDRPSNVAALCPAHHREAHFGLHRAVIANQLKEKLSVFFGTLPL